MAQPKFNSNDVLQMLIDKANENGYSIIINGTKDDALQIAVYPFRGTIVSNEEIARLLYDVIEKNALYEFAKLLNEHPEYDFIYSDEDKITEAFVHHLASCLAFDITKHFLPPGLLFI